MVYVALPLSSVVELLPCRVIEDPNYLPAARVRRVLTWGVRINLRSISNDGGAAIIFAFELDCNTTSTSILDSRIACFWLHSTAASTCSAALKVGERNQVG